jgi:hypothetical protein
MTHIKWREQLVGKSRCSLPWKVYWNPLFAKGRAQQFGNSNDPTWSKKFSALAGQKKRATLSCVPNKRKKQRKHSSAARNGTVLCALCHAWAMALVLTVLVVCWVCNVIYSNGTPAHCRARDQTASFVNQVLDQYGTRLRDDAEYGGGIATVYIYINQTPWPESASDLCRPSDRHLSTKLVPTFADKRCRVVSVPIPTAVF